MFGIVDAGVSYYQTKTNYIRSNTFVDNTQAVNHSEKQWALSKSGLQTSRIGFRGTEDLGGGLAASFWLESALNNDVGDAGGDGGHFFNRRSTVSLSGNFGEVRLGRDFTPSFWNDTDFDPFGTNGVGTSAINLAHDAFGMDPGYARTSNSIGYFLPSNLGGFYGQVQYALHENVNTDGNESQAGRYMGGRVGYANGPLNVAVAYGRSASTADDRLDTINLGASYDLGPVKLFGELSQVRLDNVRTDNDRSSKLNGYLLGLTAPVGAGLIRASYSHADYRTGTHTEFVTSPQPGILTVENPKAKADKFALGYVHNLSKRTALYATFSYTKNKNGADLTAGGNVDYGNAARTYVGYSGGYNPSKSYGYDFGIRHSF